MNLYIMRHGRAAERRPRGKDFDRQLTAEGRRKTALSAEGMKALGLRFDRICSSPLLRARETAEIVAGVMDLGTRLEITDRLRPGADLHDLLQEIGRRNKDVESILLVGHEPTLGELISLLLCGNTASAVSLKKGALCKLLSDEWGPGKRAQLEWLLTAKQMSAMRRQL